MMDFGEIFGGSADPISAMILSGYGTAQPQSQEMMSPKPRRRRRRNTMDEYSTPTTSTQSTAGGKEPKSQRDIAGLHLKSETLTPNKEGIARIAAVVAGMRQKK